MKRKLAVLLALLLVFPLTSAAESADAHSLSTDDLDHLKNTIRETLGGRDADGTEEKAEPGRSLEEIAEALDELRIVNTEAVGQEPMEITTIPDAWVYCGPQEKFVGNILDGNGKGYCVVSVSPGEVYAVSTGSNTEVAPVVWYSSTKIGHDTCIGYVPAVDAGASTLYQSWLTVPEGARCMLVQTSNMSKFPISVGTRIVTYGRIDRLADAGFVTKEEMENALAFNHDCMTEFAYDNTAGAVSVDCAYPAGERVACHIRPLNGVTGGNKLTSYIVRYYAVDSMGTETKIASGYPYNYPVASVPEGTVAIKAVYPANLSDADTLVFCVYSMEQPRQPHIITVDASGNGNFTSLRPALDSITDSDLINRYEIHIYPGVYNVLEDYSEEEILSDGFVGPIVGEGVSLVGVTAGRENIVLHGEMDPALYPSSKRNDVSTLNMICSCEVRNLTVSAKYIRYAIHDDMGESRYQESTHTFIDCVFRGDFLTSGDVGSRAFGAGGAHLKQYYFKNCVFQDMLYIHSQSNSSGYSSCVIEDCTAKYFCVRDNNSEKNAYFQLSNNQFGMIIYRKSEDEHPQYMRFSSSGECSPYVYASVPFVYEIGDTVRYRNTEIDAGYAVTSDFNQAASVTSDAAGAAGISLGSIDGDTVVLRSGYVDATLFGLNDLTVGDYIGLDATGKVTVQRDAEGAVGRVQTILGDHPFIQLFP